MIWITVGEPAGIGPDVILGAWQLEPRLFAQHCIVAPAAWLRARAQALGLDAPIKALPTPQPSGEEALGCWWPEPAPEVVPGHPDPKVSKVAIRCLEAAVKRVMEQGGALVTAPLHKAAWRRAGFRFSGHTEMLGAAAGAQPVMMLGSEALRVALVTTHLPLRAAIEALDETRIVRTVRTVHDALIRFGVARPRLALLALNPHAGEEGALGDEEIRILEPACARLAREGIAVEGPLPADSAFAPAMRARFDAYVALYHDQGLIPIKTLAFGESVNLTLGLPFVRTSPDHGTALALAGTGQAQPGGMIAALRCGALLAAKRWPWAGK